MDIFADITAVQDRIAEISGTPKDDPPVKGAFNAALAQALQPGQAGGAPRTPYGNTFPPLISQAPGAGTGDPSSGAPAPTPPADIDALVQQNAQAYEVDPNLIRSIIANESAYNPSATSDVGAQGLMQLMPETAATLGVTNAYDPAQNVAGGTRYLRSLLDRFRGDTRLAVAAYNAGPEAVEKYGDIPPYAETRNYVQNVLGSYDRYSTHN